MKNTIQNSSRVIYLDILRIIAAFFIVVLHTAVTSLDSFGTTSWEWNVSNFYDSISRWAVPVFVMISGALFLNKE